MDSALLWLMKLLAAHLLTDFVLQPKSWVIARNTAHLAAKGFWWHIVLTSMVAALLTGFDTWWLPLVIFLTHGLIDWWKSYRPDTIVYFTLDQLLHLLVIVGVWMLKFPVAVSVQAWLLQHMGDLRSWTIVVAVIMLSSPTGIVIGLMTRRFRDRIQHHEEHSLASAGTWIGILERLIIFFMVLISQFEAIGLLIAAKSIMRIKDGDQKMSEYVLIGTLLSVSVALLTGYLLKWG
jgi:predicted permease